MGHDKKCGALCTLLWLWLQQHRACLCVRQHAAHTHIKFVQAAEGRLRPLAQGQEEGHCRVGALPACECVSSVRRRPSALDCSGTLQPWSARKGSPTLEKSCSVNPAAQSKLKPPCYPKARQCPAAPGKPSISWPAIDKLRTLQFFGGTLTKAGAPHTRQL